MNFKPGQLVRRTKLSTVSFVTPIVPLGMVVQIVHIYEGYMEVLLLHKANKNFSAGKTIRVTIDHYSPVNLMKRKHNV